MITDGSYQENFNTRMSDDSDTATTGSPGAQDKESPIRFTSTSTRAPFLLQGIDNTNYYKIRVWHSPYCAKDNPIELNL